MGRAATDADYNAAGNEVHMKVEIYFNGINQTPLTVTTENYLIDLEILEESGADYTWPLGEVSANEITFSLYNNDGMFSPTNKLGPYYSKMKPGVIVKPFIRPGNLTTDDINWEQMGELKITAWQAEITSIVATVTAQDVVKDIYLAEKIELPVTKNVPVKNFYTAVFDYFSLPHSIDPLYETKLLPYAFIATDNTKTLQDMTIATRGICMSNRQGLMSLKPVNINTLRATITDMNQVITVSSDQNIQKNYDGVALYYSSPQLSSNTLLLSMRTLKVKPGIQIHDKFTLTKGMMLTITNISVIGNQKVFVQNYNATPNSIIITTISNATEEIEVNVGVYGVILEHVEQVLKDDDDTGNMLEIRNDYIQTSVEATAFKAALDVYIAEDVPELEVPIKGNPLLMIGDKVRVISELYKVDYTGIIKRSVLRYDGGLSGYLVILNASVFGGA